MSDNTHIQSVVESRIKQLTNADSVRYQIKVDAEGEHDLHRVVLEFDADFVNDIPSVACSDCGMNEYLDGADVSVRQVAELLQESPCELDGNVLYTSECQLE